jgi:acyl dehydratase
MTRERQASTLHTFSQADFDRFARLSGDDNPIHTDAEFSARSRFGRTVAHGLLLCSVLRGQIDRLVPGGRLTGQSVMFPAPTFSGETMRFTAAVIGGRGDDTSLELSLRVERVEDGLVTCQGHCRVEP